MISRSSIRPLLLAFITLSGTAVLLWAEFPPGFVWGFVALVTVLAGFEYRFSHRNPSWLPAVRHAAELWVSANPAYRLEDKRVPAGLREALTLLAGNAQRPQGELQAAVSSATSALQQDSMLLRALVESMDEAAIICTVDGRVLLYNAAAARKFSDGHELALGRSIFTIFRRWAFSHFVARLGTTRRVNGMLSSRAGQSFHARFTSLELEGRSGILLALQPLTEIKAAGRDLTDLLQPRRARLGNLLAALEMLQDHADLSVAEHERLLGVAANETRALVDSFRALSDRLQNSRATPLDDVAARDLVPMLQERLKLPALEPTGGAQKSFWLRAESASLAGIAQSLGHWLTANECQPVAVETREDLGYGCVVMRWQGAVELEPLRQWENAPLREGSAHAQSIESASPIDVMEWQGGALWSETSAEGGSVTLLLETAEEPESTVSEQSMPPARPEYFDFALFDAPRKGWEESVPLNQLALTAFDTETTGLNPREGDEIISIGAIRVLNGRLLGQEVFETLVRSEHPINPESQKIHGIDATMLQGAPSQAESWQRFQVFAGDNLLLGHNVAFDLRFLQIAAVKHGLAQPPQALDTLLLSSVVYPEREQHRLEDIAQRLGIAVLGRHTSLGDALLTAEVFCRLIPLLEHKGIHTLGQALAASRESWYARLDY